VLLACPLHVLLLRYPRFLGAGLHLSHLSHFRGPAQRSRNGARVTLRESSRVLGKERLGCCDNDDLKIALFSWHRRWRILNGPPVGNTEVPMFDGLR
jgi:hypothetical protein